jgi:ribose/xylose/arabinose/galactoside ABC-type transport system permease subunit
MRSTISPGARLFALRIPILVVLLSAAFSLLSADFFSLGTIEKVLFLLPSEGAVAIGMTLVMIIGELDMTVGGVFALSGIVLYRLLPLGLPVALIAALAMGAAIGLANGIIIFRLRVNSLIATIAVSFILSGLALLAVDKTVQIVSPPLVGFGNGSLWLFPYSALFFLALVALFQFLLRRTRFGLRLYAVGGSRISSQYSGISTKATGIGIFVLSGIFAALGGLLYAARLAAASPLYGGDTAIYVLTAALLGGTAIGGGSGDVVKTLLGILLLSIFSKGFTMLQVPAFYQNMIIGAILILLLLAGKTLEEKRT